MSAFAEALALTLQFEGGYSDVADDRGGATNFGITQKVYDHYLNGLGDPLNDVADISSAEVAAIYRMWYWNPAHADALVSRLAKVHFDSAVNHGVGRAVKFLQQLVGVTTDGMWGPATFAAVASADQDALVTPTSRCGVLSTARSWRRTPRRRSSCLSGSSGWRSCRRRWREECAVVCHRTPPATGSCGRVRA